MSEISPKPNGNESQRKGNVSQKKDDMIIRTLSEVVANFPAAVIDTPDDSNRLNVATDVGSFPTMPEVYNNAQGEQEQLPKQPLLPKLEKQTQVVTLLDQHDQNHVFGTHLKPVRSSSRTMTKRMTSSPTSRKLSPVLETGAEPNLPIEKLCISSDTWTPPFSTIDNRVFGFNKQKLQNQNKTEVLSNFPVDNPPKPALTFEEIYARIPDSSRSKLAPDANILSRMYDHMDLMDAVQHMDPYSEEYQKLPRSIEAAMFYHQNRRLTHKTFQYDNEPTDLQRAMNHIQWRKIVIGEARDEDSRRCLLYFLAAERILEVEQIPFLINEILFLEDESRNSYSAIERELIYNIIG